MVEILQELNRLNWPGAAVLIVGLIFGAGLIAFGVFVWVMERGPNPLDEILTAKPDEVILPRPKRKFPDRGTPEYFAYVEEWLLKESVDTDRQWRILRELSRIEAEREARRNGN